MKRHEGMLPSVQQMRMLLGVGLLFGTVFVLRYLGQWAENDTAVFVRTAKRLMEVGALEYQGAYPHGFAFPVWLATLSSVTGMPPSALTAGVVPLISGTLLASMGFVTFSAMLGSRRGGLLAAGVLFLTPELVFTVMRGNHEKLTVSLTLLAAAALLASFLELSGRRRWGVFAGWVSVLYACTFTLASLNSFFGSTFILAVTASWVFASVLVGLRREAAKDLRQVLRRLILVSVTGWALVALVIFFLYPPASDAIRTMSSATERVAALALSFEPESDPYEAVASDWSNVWAHRTLSSFRFVLFVASFAWWLHLLVLVVQRPGKQSLRRLYLIALYGAFGLQLAVAIPVDLVGLDAGSNLQVRLYTYFTILAAPVFVDAVRHFLSGLGAGRRYSAERAIGVALAVFAVLSVGKATLEPTFSNRWIFYRTPEVRALRFWDGRHSQQSIWTGPDARVRQGYVMAYGSSASRRNTFDVWTVSSRSTHALKSDAIAASTAVWRFPPSAYWVENRPFDNGDAQLYHRLPRTPFQR